VHIERSSAKPDALEGLVLSQEVRGDGGRTVFAKGHVLSRGDVPVLLGLSWDRLHAAAMDEGEVHEESAGHRIAEAAAGAGVAVGSMSGGHWPLTAEWRGIIEVDVDALRRVNSIEGACVYTVFGGQVADAGEVIARAKITPFALAETRVRDAESIAEDARGLVRVRPFRPMRVGAVVQETLGEKAMARFRDALNEKVAWFGARLLEPRFVAPDPGAIADAIQGSAAGGADVIAIAGTKAMDLLDPTFVALERLSAPIERQGVPAHPGSLFWLARYSGIAIVGVPTCGLFSQATVFDLLLPRILAGDAIGRAELAELGHGGLLTREMSFRFPPYRPSKNRGEVD
jgi:hypothetical protein